MDASLLESYFDFCYAKSIKDNMLTVFKKKCFGCLHDSLSQTDHTCLTFSRKEQLELYFDEVLQHLDENEILRQWEETVSSFANADFVNLYKLKFYCRDWRETDMRCATWKTKMVKLVFELFQLENRLN